MIADRKPILWLIAKFRNHMKYMEVATVRKFLDILAPETSGKWHNRPSHTDRSANIDQIRLNL